MYPCHGRLEAKIDIKIQIMFALLFNVFGDACLAINFVSVIQVYGYNNSNEAPKWCRSLVSIKKIIQKTMNKIRHQTDE